MSRSVRRAGPACRQKQDRQPEPRHHAVIVHAQSIPQLAGEASPAGDASMAQPRLPAYGSPNTSTHPKKPLAELSLQR
jgi:hypothetical protein